MSADTELTRARGLLAARRFPEAAEVCRAGLAAQPGEPELLTVLALCDQAEGRSDQAREHLQAAIAADDQHLASRFHLARLLAGQGQHVEADELFGQCLALDPNHAPARTLRARLARVSGDHERAISELKTALRADPEHRPALTTLADLLVDSGQIEAAHDIASRALGIDPDHPSVQLCMARVLAAQGRQDFAAQCLANAIKAAPHDPEPHLARVALLQASGRDEDALAALDEAAAAGHSAIGFTHARAQIERRRGRTDAAAALYASLVASVRAAPELILEAAEFALASGRLKDAAALIQRPSVQDRPEATLLAARLAEAEGDDEQARSLAMGLVSASTERVAVAARQLVARVALAAGDLAAADQALTPLSEADNASPEIVWLASRIRAEQGDVDGAVGLLEGLLARGDLESEIRERSRVRLAVILDRAGRIDAAARQLPESGWRPPFLGQASAVDDAGASIRKALTPWRWDTQAPGDGRPRPVFVGGWPGSGRELLLAALNASSQAGLLPADDFAARRGIIGLPAGSERVASLDDGSAHLIRRKYLRRSDAAGERLRVVVESGVVEAADWPLLARIFPGAAVLCPRAPDEDLMLHWRFQGFGQRADMLAGWRRDCALQDELSDVLPLNVILFELEELLADPESAVQRLCEGLELEPEPAMRAAPRELRQDLGLHPLGHWRHYSQRMRHE